MENNIRGCYVRLETNELWRTKARGTNENEYQMYLHLPMMVAV